MRGRMYVWYLCVCLMPRAFVNTILSIGKVEAGKERMEEEENKEKEEEGE